MRFGRTIQADTYPDIEIAEQPQVGVVQPYRIRLYAGVNPDTGTGLARALL